MSENEQWKPPAATAGLWPSLPGAPVATGGDTPIDPGSPGSGPHGASAAPSGDSAASPADMTHAARAQALSDLAAQHRHDAKVAQIAEREGERTSALPMLMRPDQMTRRIGSMVWELVSPLIEGLDERNRSLVGKANTLQAELSATRVKLGMAESDADRYQQAYDDELRVTEGLRQELAQARADLTARTRRRGWLG